MITDGIFHTLHDTSESNWLLVFVELDSSLAYYVDAIIKGYILAVGTHTHIYIYIYIYIYIHLKTKGMHVTSLSPILL